MTRRHKDLEALDKQALIEGYVLLEGRVRSLEKEVRDLRTLLDGSVSPPPKTPTNSSIPPSQDRKAKRKKKRSAKRGPKAGHEGKSRQRSTPDEILECRLSACSGCGHALSDLAQHEVGRHQVIDLPPIRPLVREVVRYGCICPGCQRYERAASPPGFERGRRFGPHLKRLVVYLHHAHPLSYERVKTILQDVFDLTISPGTLVNWVKGATRPLQAASEAILNQLTQEPVVGSDETGARVAGENHWQWAFQSPQWVWMTINPSRGSQVIEQHWRGAQPEVWVSDLAPAQLHHPAKAFQACLAHQVRDLQYEIDARRCRWSYHLQALFYRAIRLGKQRQAIPPPHYLRQVSQIEQQLDHLLNAYPAHPDSQRLWRRYRKHRKSLLLFLHRDDVPPTNNASEQALRNSVIYRKVSGGFRTDWGAALYADAISIFETARRQKRHLLDTLSAVLAQQPTFAAIPE